MIQNGKESGKGQKKVTPNNQNRLVLLWENMSWTFRVKKYNVWSSRSPRQILAQMAKIHAQFTLVHGVWFFPNHCIRPPSLNSLFRHHQKESPKPSCGYSRQPVSRQCQPPQGCFSSKLFGTLLSNKATTGNNQLKHYLNSRIKERQFEA